ncbi:class V chitinase CHIT5b-like [Rhodamnia argentea]|uniref:Class V chitinase CHIT5b-like n=1 Tax=Rhodamnia argentea TaxID=178133 RepID=A0A8B8QJI3_9MYRT|nr:class V chitinase CHIT5b-like [Rhodamnia argentea]
MASVDVTASSSSSSSSSSTIKGSYYPSWTTDFTPSDIDTTLFSHIFYAFLSPSNITFKFELPEPMAAALSNFTTTLRFASPPVKTVLSIGGAGDAPTALLAEVASSPSSRKDFINSSVEVARKFGFDGLDLDWEWPKNPKEMDDLAHLLREWRLVITEEARATKQPPLLLTAAVYFASDFFLDPVYRMYPVADIRENLDWINAMCYDYHGAWDTSATGAQAAFFDPKSNLSSIHGLNSWLWAGMPRKQIVMGLPLYARTWELKDPNVTEIGAPAVKPGPGGGLLTYSEVQVFNRNNSATVVYDAETVSTYSFSGTSWVGYDDVASAMVKIGLAQALGLRGYFFWALSFETEWQISSQASRAWILDD